MQDRGRALLISNEDFGNPGRADPGVAGGVADQDADRLLAAQHRVDLLPDHRR
jgi:hypothetical protein